MPPEELQEKTREYWDSCRRLGEPERNRRYLEELLPLEMDDASGRGAFPPDSRRSGLLVLMLGFSVEPLLQSILAYRPREVLVVYSRSYETVREDIEGVEQFSRFRKLVASLCRQPWASRYLVDRDLWRRVCGPPTRADGADSPVEVFDAIRSWVIPTLRQEPGLRERIIIDITGAKKSMVTGAYLFATFARVPVSYVDFDLYDPDYQRPYGFTCRFEILESPADGYHLDAWRRAHQQYQHAAYGALSETLRAIIDGMENGRGLFSPHDIDATRRLHTMACCYASWAEGDYRGALAHWQTAGRPEIVLPSAVEHLAAVWPERVSGCAANAFPEDLMRLESGPAIPSDSSQPLPDAGAVQRGSHSRVLKESLFGRRDLMALYVQDEINKIGNLIAFTDDFRSALLRAAGLNEVLLKYRVIQHWRDGQIDGQIECHVQTGRTKQGDREYGQPFPASALTAGQRQAIDSRFSDVSSARALVAFLQDRKWLNLQPVHGEDGECASTGLGIRRSTAPDPPANGPGTLDAMSLANCRNKAAHFTLPVTRALATEALDLAQRSASAYGLVSAGPRAPGPVTSWDTFARAIEFLPPFDDKPAAEGES